MITKIDGFSEPLAEQENLTDISLHSVIYDCIDEISNKLSISKDDALYYFANIFADDFSYGRDFLNNDFPYIQQEVKSHLNGTECRSQESLDIFASHTPEEASIIFNELSNQETEIALHDSPANHLKALRISGLLSSPEEFGELYCKYPFSNTPPLMSYSLKADDSYNITYKFAYNPLNAKFAYDVTSQIDCMKLDISSSNESEDDLFHIFYYLTDLASEYLPFLKDDEDGEEVASSSFPEEYDPEFEGDAITIDISSCKPNDDVISSSYCFAALESQ